MLKNDHIYFMEIMLEIRRQSVCFINLFIWTTVTYRKNAITRERVERFRFFFHKNHLPICYQKNLVSFGRAVLKCFICMPLPPSRVGRGLEPWQKHFLSSKTFTCKIWFHLPGRGLKPSQKHFLSSKTFTCQIWFHLLD